MAFFIDFTSVNGRLQTHSEQVGYMARSCQARGPGRVAGMLTAEEGSRASPQLAGHLEHLVTDARRL